MSKEYTKVIEDIYPEYMLDQHEKYRKFLKKELKKEERKIQELQRKIVAEEILVKKQ